MKSGSDLEQRVHFTAAYDKRHPEPSRNYGIHDVEIRFLLGGDLGWVQFVLATGWHLPEVLGLDETADRYGLGGLNYGRALADFSAGMHGPTPCDLGYHAPEPQYEGQGFLDCDLLPAGRCYYDGSGLNAVAPFYSLLNGGTEGLWEYLAHYHAELFGAVPA